MTVSYLLSLAQSNAFADSPPPAPGTGGTAAPTQSSTQVANGMTGAPPQPSPMSMLLPFGIMFLVIYFLMIRPQQKKMKEHQAQLTGIQHGDEIVSNGGLIGKVTGVTDKVLTVEIADGVRVKMLKGQVAAVNPKFEAGASK